MKKHVISCEKSSSSKATQSTITTYYGRKPAAVPEKLRREIVDSYVNFVALDGHLFKIVCDVGFQQFIVTVFKATKSSSGVREIEVSNLYDSEAIWFRCNDRYVDRAI